MIVANKVLCDSPGCKSSAEFGTPEELRGLDKAVETHGWHVIDDAGEKKHYCQLHGIESCSPKKT